jgi:hypothetical protein
MSRLHAISRRQERAERAIAGRGTAVRDELDAAARLLPELSQQSGPARNRWKGRDYWHHALIPLPQTGGYRCVCGARAISSLYFFNRPDDAAFVFQLCAACAHAGIGIGG